MRSPRSNHSARSGRSPALALVLLLALAAAGGCGGPEEGTGVPEDEESVPELAFDSGGEDLPQLSIVHATSLPPAESVPDKTGDGAPAPPAPPGPVLKVLTLNIRGHAAGATELEKIASLLVAEDPDLVGLQEVYWYVNPSANQAQAIASLVWAKSKRSYHVALQTQHSYAVAGIGVALLSKPAFTALHAHVLPKVEEEGRVVLHAALASTPPVDAFVTHLTNDAAKAATQAIDLLSWTSSFGGRPQILVGDFNAGPSSAAHGTLASKYVDAWTATHGAAGGATIPADKPAARIDYIFVRDPARALSAAIKGSAALSDHLALTAEVEIAR